MTLQQMEVHEGELYQAVANRVADWGNIRGVIGAGLGRDDTLEAHPGYVVVVVLNSDVKELYQLPKSLAVDLDGEHVVLPVRVERTTTPQAG